MLCMQIGTTPSASTHHTKLILAKYIEHTVLTVFFVYKHVGSWYCKTTIDIYINNHRNTAVIS